MPNLLGLQEINLVFVVLRLRIDRSQGKLVGGVGPLSFGEQAMKATIAERRTSPRFACGLETSCRLLGPRKGQTKARVLGRSTGGGAPWLNAWYGSGTFFAVALPRPYGHPTLRPSG